MNFKDTNLWYATSGDLFLNSDESIVSMWKYYIRYIMKNSWSEK
jgi:hypothetical protein